MKVLITGSTPMHVGKTAKLLLFAQCHVVRDALMRLGHTVEHREVPINEALAGAPGFDRVIIFQAPYLMLGANYALATLILIQTRSDAILAFEDGTRLSNFQQHYSQMVRTPAYFFDRFIGLMKHGRDEVVASKRAKSLVEKSVAELAMPVWQRPSLVALFPWGSIAMLAENVRGMFSQATVYDPSSMVPLPRVVGRGKKKHWVLATLGNHQKWVDRHLLRWPVSKFGYHGERITEPEVLRHYSDSWGVLCPRQPVTAAGWWRARFNFAAHVGSVLLCDKADAAAAAFPDVYGKAPGQIEEMKPAALIMLAAEQARIMWKKTWSADQLLGVIGSVIRDRQAKAA
jgi:hypothetical protein